MRTRIELLVLFALLICAGAARSEQSVTLAWDPNPETDIGGYIVYYGSASRNYTNAVNVGNVTTNTVSGLVDGATYFFAVTAYNTNGLESDFSDEVSYSGPSSSPVLTLLRTLFTRTNQVVRGTCSPPLPEGVWFEYARGTNGENWELLAARPPTNGIYWATVVLDADAWRLRICASNVANRYVSRQSVISTIPLRPPARIRFQLKIIESASLDGPWEESMQASVVVPYPPEGPQKFYRSMFTYTPEYAKEE